MHLEILTQRQRELLDVLAHFKKEYCLAGGTAVALHIGHRRSIDYDLFTAEPVSRLAIRNFFKKSSYPIEQILYEEEGQLHIIVHAVKLTFYQYPYGIDRSQSLANGLAIPSLLTLAAMKAMALGGRAKWKDYVDLYFLLRDHVTLPEICRQATQMFADDFNEKLYREQLAYFADIDYSEEVDYLVPNPGKKQIQAFLTGLATAAWHSE